LKLCKIIWKLRIIIKYKRIKISATTKKIHTNTNMIIYGNTIVLSYENFTKTMREATKND